jgi:hypothetical protein
MKRRHGHTPRYSLKRVQELVDAGHDHYYITESARLGAQSIFLDEEDIVECVCSLTEDDYEKTLDSRRFPGTFQDVYKPRFYGLRIYLKVTLDEDEMAVIISFKRDESA